MSTPINDGGPAFPEAVTKNDRYDQSAYVASEGGMTLRDYFAGQALAGLTSDNVTLSIFRDEGTGSVTNDAAVASYRYADAMLKARGAST